MSTDSLSELIRLRVTPYQLQKYSAAAAMEGRTLSDYLRRRLDIADNTAKELEALRALIVDYRSTGQSSVHRQEDHLACAVESLLLLRSLATPQILRSVHADLQRINLTPFSAL